MYFCLQAWTFLVDWYILILKKIATTSYNITKKGEKGTFYG